MQFHRKGIVFAVVASSLLWSLNARADWAQSTDPLVVQPAPTNGQVQAQNPPGFTWARYPTGPASYDIQITPAGGSPVTYTTDRNWYLPTKALAMGNYTWRVRPTGSSTWSDARAFSITSKSTVFEVPDNATLHARILAKARPRSLSSSFSPYASWSSAKKNDLDPYESRLINECKLQITALPNLSDSRWPIVITSSMTAAMASQQTDVRNQINAATRQLEIAALLWRSKGDSTYLNEALKRGDQLAALDPNGPTSYANGTAYAEYTAGYQVALWDPMVAATGINLYAKPWTLGFLDFATEFTPPGSKKHAFGDGDDTAPDPRVFHAFAGRMVSPRAAWYVANLSGLEDSLSVLEAPYPMPVAGTTVKTPPANSAYYPSIGWVAMHSDIGSTGRTSFFFKSSPYGSFNHSHGDQNGLLLSVAGQPLLVKAGWYDWYGSPYWTDWYSQTKSSNSITFDGGKGQNTAGYRETLQHNGKITGFSAQPTYDYAEGDATPAYAGALTMAKRQTWYLHSQNAVLVRDKLSATVAHTYEFNIHAPAAMTILNSNNVQISAGGQSVCVRSLNGNAPFAKWTGATPKSGVTEDHGAFYLKGAANATSEFLVLLDVGCKNPAVKVTTSGTTRTVTVGTQTVTLP